jgi:signal transduction histidine kinase
MRFRTWPVAAVALGGLVLLVVFSVLTASRKAQAIYTQVDGINDYYRRVDSKLRRLRSDVHLSGIFVRDYLLDPARERAPEYRQRLADFRRTNRATFGELRALTGGPPENEARLQSLQAKLEDYWQALDPLFDWSPAEKVSRSAAFLRREVIPRREAILAIAWEIEEFNNETLAAQQGEVGQRQAALRSDLHNLLWGSLVLGVVVAITAVIRLRILERRSEDQRAIAEDAERQMRALSQQLVAAQEEERKHLSRELHDHVGQVLTALRMELGRIERLRASGAGTVSDELVAAVGECRQLVDSMVRTVRDLALGLRPSMLDDLGLQPALEWHVRDFTRRYGLPVQLDVTGELERLPDQHRTCVYRVIQEALTNCIRHASATRVSIRVSGGPDSLEVTVADNGIGLEPERRRLGLGLRGIGERVRDLGGTMTIHGSGGRGTTLAIRLPLPTQVLPTEVTLARAAG